MVPAGLSTRYREILTSGTPTAELERQASALYLRAAGPATASCATSWTA